MKKSIVSTALLSLAVAAAACSSGGGGGGGGGPTTHISITKFGGIIAFLNTPTSLDAFAIFYSSMTPEQTVTADFSDGNCVNPVTTNTNAVPTYGDAGTHVTFTNGATVLTALKTTGGGSTIGYSYSDVGVPGASDWSVANDGGTDISAQTLVNFHLPAAISLLATPTIVPGQPADVTFTPNTGAVAVNVHISGNLGSVNCFSADDGTFTIPGTATAQAGSNATVTVSAANLGVANVNGRQVLWEAVSGN